MSPYFFALLPGLCCSPPAPLLHGHRLDLPVRAVAQRRVLRVRAAAHPKVLRLGALRVGDGLRLERRAVRRVVRLVRAVAKGEGRALQARGGRGGGADHRGLAAAAQQTRRARARASARSRCPACRGARGALTRPHVHMYLVSPAASVIFTGPSVMPGSFFVRSAIMHGQSVEPSWRMGTHGEGRVRIRWQRGEAPQPAAGGASAKPARAASAGSKR